MQDNKSDKQKKLDDLELDKLNRLETPEPSARAKKAAIQAAREAFIAAQESTEAQDIEKSATNEKNKKNSDTHQGIAYPPRPTHSFLLNLWSILMRKHLISGGLLTVLIAFTGFALYIGNQQSSSFMLGEVVESSDSDTSKSPNRAFQISPETTQQNTSKPEKTNINDANTVTQSKQSIQRNPTKQTSQNASASPVASAPTELARQPALQLKQEPSAFTASIPRETAPTSSRDRFEQSADSPVKKVSEHPVSTFSIDVDTASYAFVRRSLTAGQLPPRDAVRVEEMINYFNYNYPSPSDAKTPFQATTTMVPTPWNENTQLLHIGIQGLKPDITEKPKSNMVFLIDTSGSMNQPDRLPLLQQALRLLLEQLSEQDSIAIVTYSGAARTVLEPTTVANKSTILQALDTLQAGGSTAGAQGIEQAYALAKKHYDDEAVNRVMLATDGDFNVGITNIEELKAYISEQRKSGIYLSVLGFGQGNYNDQLMQQLAQNGNGNAAYIDTINEAHKVLVENATANLFPIANDVKIQIEFNPQHVSEYRLIGYETRALNREDFNNDAIDAGDIGAGHQVTAIYEITPKGVEKPYVDELRYGNNHTNNTENNPSQEKPAEIDPVSENDSTAFSNEIAFLKMRYKRPNESTSQLITQAITQEQAVENLNKTSDAVRFAISVAAFGQKLRGNPYVQAFDYNQIIALAESAKGSDTFGYRSEMIRLLRLAQSYHGK